MPNSFSDARKIVEECIETLNSIEEPPANSDKPSIDCAFDPLLNVILVIPNPPKQLKIVEFFSEGKKQFLKSLNELLHICSVVKCETLSELFEFLTRFAAADSSVTFFKTAAGMSLP